MRPGSVLLLAVVTAAAVAVAVSLSAVRGAGGADASRGEPFVSGLVDKINDVDSIEISGAGGQTVLRRDGEGFLDGTGYPARLSVVRDLLTQLSVLVIEEAKTDRPDRYPELSLAAPDAEDGGARRITLRDGDEVIADVYLGKAESSVGGTRGGLYARREGEARSWLLRGAVELPGARAGWLVNRLLEIKRDDIATVSLESDAGAVRLARAGEGEPLRLQDPPPDREEDAAAIGRLTAVVDGLAFADVRKAGEGDPDGPVLTVTTRDGLVVRVGSVVQVEQTKGRWIRIDVEAGSGTDPEQVAALRARTEGYEFEVRGADAEALGMKPAAFLKF